MWVHYCYGSQCIYKVFLMVHKIILIQMEKSLMIQAFNDKKLSSASLSYMCNRAGPYGASRGRTPPHPCPLPASCH